MCHMLDNLKVFSSVFHIVSDHFELLYGLDWVSRFPADACALLLHYLLKCCLLGTVCTFVPCHCGAASDVCVHPPLHTPRLEAHDAYYHQESRRCFLRVPGWPLTQSDSTSLPSMGIISFASTKQSCQPCDRNYVKGIMGMKPRATDVLEVHSQVKFVILKQYNFGVHRFIDSIKRN